MKKTLIALAALAATGAFAQSTVTLSGALDVGIENVTGAASQVQASRNSTSNITFAGSEELGGGLKANFLVSTSFDPTYDDAVAGNGNAGTGTAAKIGNNNMYVGLAGGFGEVRAGRPMTTVYAMSQTANGTKGVSGFAATNSISSGGVYAANTMQYISPSFSGFTAQLEYTASEQKDVNSGHAIGLKYANGPLTVTAVRNDQIATVVNGANSAQITQLAASYDFKVAKVLATMQRDDAKTDGNKASNVISVTAPVGAAGLVWLQLGYQESSAAAGNKSITGLGYKHSLSKRTTAYVAYGNRNDAAAGANGTTGYNVGVAHSF